MELRDYWRTIKRRWMTIVACLLLTVAVAGVVTWQTTPQYASTARLFVSTSPSDAFARPTRAACSRPSGSRRTPT